MTLRELRDVRIRWMLYPNMQQQEELRMTIQASRKSLIMVFIVVLFDVTLETYQEVVG